MSPDPPLNASPVTLVIPCYNEEVVVPHLLPRLADLRSHLMPRYELEVIFVDDGSRDKTVDLLAEAVADHDWMKLARHTHNKGIAAAILTGIRSANTEIVSSIDADCSYDPMHLGALLDELRSDVALVTASPYHALGKVVDVPPWRVFLSRGLSVLYALTLRQRLATYTSCFRVYRRSSMVDVELSDGGFTGIAEMLAMVDLQEGRIVEVPVALTRRAYGESKMRVAKTVVGHLRLLGRLWLRKLGLVPTNRLLEGQ